MAALEERALTILPEYLVGYYAAGADGAGTLNEVTEHAAHAMASAGLPPRERFSAKPALAPAATQS
jgi:hypothetical protein